MERVGIRYLTVPLGTLQKFPKWAPSLVFGDIDCSNFEINCDIYLVRYYTIEYPVIHSRLDS